MPQPLSNETLDALQQAQSIQDFCEQWEQYRTIALAAQVLLQTLYPPAAKVLRFLIQIADASCQQTTGQ